MGHLATIDIVGFWIGIFLTFCILSFLYKDNPIYKFAEHLYIGISIGYIITKQYYDVIQPKLLYKLWDGQWLYFIALALSIMFLMRTLSERWNWIGRYPIAIIVAFYAGLQINGVAQGDLGPQLREAMSSVDVQRVNINEASEEEIAGLPGLSPIVAKKDSCSTTPHPL